MTHFIHETAIVSPKAKLGKGVYIGPHSIVGDGITLGDNCRLESHVSLAGNVTMGKDNVLSPFVTMGHPPQDFKHKGGEVGIIIGDRNKFREYANVHPGTDVQRRANWRRCYY